MWGMANEHRRTVQEQHGIRFSFAEGRWPGRLPSTTVTVTVEQGGRTDVLWEFSWRSRVFV
jgi:hypothetical protein